MLQNNLFISAAGSGKTTLIIKRALSNNHKNILITTYTLENKRSIINKIIKFNKFIPNNITIQTWFSFLIEHGLKPYRFWPNPIEGLIFNEGRSAIYTSENDINAHYFKNNRVYRDKIAKLVCKCNENSSGSVIKRLENIYSSIYIDEVQDFSGYDLELIKLFMKSSMEVILVGDPRQCAYETHNESKNSRYRHGKISLFIKEKCKNIPINIDTITLNSSYRNSPEICKLANSLYPEYPICMSSQKEKNYHTGIFFIKNKDIDKYLQLYSPQKLRYKKDKNNLDMSTLNFGESKGLEFEHILIYPTLDFLKWLKNREYKLKDVTKAKIYIALTRAFFSVAIVVDNTFKAELPDIQLWIPEE